MCIRDSQNIDIPHNEYNQSVCRSSVTVTAHGSPGGSSSSSSSSSSDMPPEEKEISFHNPVENGQKILLQIFPLYFKALRIPTPFHQKNKRYKKTKNFPFAAGIPANQMCIRDRLRAGQQGDGKKIWKQKMIL